jgi:acyl-CoA dehydrogenase
MDFDFSDEQKMFREEVRKALARACPVTEVRKVLEGEGSWAAPAWEALVEQGVTAADVAEEHGGLGLSVLELAVAAEEVGYALAPTPLFTSIGLALEVVRRAGSTTQQAAWLPSLAQGTATATVALGLHGVLPCLAADGTAEGELTAVPDGLSAGAIFFRALAADGQVHWCRVVAAAAGSERRSQDSIDPTRPLAAVKLRQAAVEVLGGGADAATVLQAVLQRGAVLLAFEQLGGAARALDDARKYVLDRRAFGRQVGAYQAMKHKLVDIYTAVELARVHVYYSAWALQTNAPELPVAAAGARVAASQAYALAAQEGLQAHGGFGFTWAADCHLHYRRARWSALILGNVHDWREQLVAGLVATGAAAAEAAAATAAV